MQDTVQKIIHIDMDAFYASVEQRDFPQYRNKPVIVGGSAEDRGVVAACSYEARKFGIHSAMPSRTAKQRCPQAIFLKPRFEAYRQCSEQIRAIFKQFSDVIEPLSLDEAYLDVTDSPHCQGSATLIAKQIKSMIKQQLNLTASAGVSYNKFLAKTASDMDKPDGLFVILPEQAADILQSMAIRQFYGIGKATERKMKQLGIHNGADLKACSQIFLARHFGKAGVFYYNIVRGEDKRLVKNETRRRSIGSETTFSTDTLDQDEILQTLSRLTTKVIESLNHRSFVAKTITLKVKYKNFQQVTRSQTLEKPFEDDTTVLEWLPRLMYKTDIGRVPIRLIGITLSSLEQKNPIIDEIQHSIF